MEILHAGIQRFERNHAGRDFAVGDIHGNFSALEDLLEHVGFDGEVDRLFSVGDLIDRGAESRQVLEWLERPWFHAVQGNHELMAVYGVGNTLDYQRSHMLDGGRWFYDLSTEEQLEYCNAFINLPLIIEVETVHGTIGIVHADIPFDDWSHLDYHQLTQEEVYDCQWSRKRLNLAQDHQVRNIRAVIHGHTPLNQMLVLGNVFFIDTTGWGPEYGGFFTLLELKSLLPYTLPEFNAEGVLQGV